MSSLFWFGFVWSLVLCAEYFSTRRYLFRESQSLRRFKVLFPFFFFFFFGPKHASIAFSIKFRLLCVYLLCTFHFAGTLSLHCFRPPSCVVFWPGSSALSTIFRCPFRSCPFFFRPHFRICPYKFYLIRQMACNWDLNKCSQHPSHVPTSKYEYTYMYIYMYICRHICT